MNDASILKIAKLLCDAESHKGWDGAPPGLRLHYTVLATRVVDVMKP